ncbi:MAG: hypothetical protein ACYDCK_06325 [Thermoplasmatota archaeon]
MTALKRFGESRDARGARRTRGWRAPGIVGAFVLTSSYLGLSARLLLGLPYAGGAGSGADPGGSVSFFTEVWTASLTADLFFVLASLGVAWTAFALADRGRVVASLTFSFAATLAVHLLAFLLLAAPPAVGTGAPGLSQVAADGRNDLATTARFVWTWGSIGITFATIAPALAAAVARATAPSTRHGGAARPEA